MEEENNRVSFRMDKKSSTMSSTRTNKFGHTVTNHNTDKEDPNVQLRVGGTSGVEAYVDIFDSPMLKKFMDENNLDLENVNSALQEGIIEIDLSEDEAPVVSQFIRPESLEEFDKIADEVMGISQVKSTKKSFAQTDSSDVKLCAGCNCKIKANSKFCSNCGKPQVLATFCKNCGHKFDASEKFCSECGNKRE